LLFFEKTHRKGTIMQRFPLNERIRSVEAGGAMAEVLAELAKHKRLSKLELSAGAMFLRDLTAHHGRSGQTGIPTNDRVDTSINLSGSQVWAHGWTRAHERCQRALDALRRHEREVLEWMICHREKARPDLASLGRRMSTYSDKAQAVAAGVSCIAGVLRTLAEVYLPEQTRRAA
jgi:hypothetical protein